MGGIPYEADPGKLETGKDDHQKYREYHGEFHHGNATAMIVFL